MISVKQGTLRIFFFFQFLLTIMYELVVANLRVAYAVLMPGERFTPALIKFPLDCTRDIQITILANVISLTPGTITLEITEDKQNLLLHVMFFTHKNEMIQHIKKRFERPVLRIWP